ncbi:MAG TPA: hypothetical protein PLL35_01170, partial [Candidatus Cloacimonas sp.]|nr:hypothetical protein [Candidatus Cloacimonas sp.]
RGAYATIAMIVSPLGAFSKGQRGECLEIFKSILPVFFCCILFTAKLNLLYCINTSLTIP